MFCVCVLRWGECDWITLLCPHGKKRKLEPRTNSRNLFFFFKRNPSHTHTHTHTILLKQIQMLRSFRRLSLAELAETTSLISTSSTGRNKCSDEKMFAM